MFIKSDSKIYVAGHGGMVGSAVVRRLTHQGFGHLVFRTRRELDLMNQSAVDSFFRSQSIDVVVLAAARVGGIWANQTQPGQFMYENLLIASNVIRAAADHGVQRLLYLGSSCIYPKLAVQPIKEEALLTAALEPTNEAYALAKIAGLKLCEMYYRQYGLKYVSVMPTNLYGINDNFHPINSHVIPGMMRRFHEARVGGAAHVDVWGTGTALREFLHVDDLARALQLVLEAYDSPETINVGSGEELSIAELARLMADVVGFKGDIVFDRSKPDGTPRKILDSSKLAGMGWQPQISLREGLRATYAWACQNRVFENDRRREVLT
jgi:GDP-L-fucose synthase